MSKSKPLSEKELCELGGYCMSADDLMAQAWEMAGTGKLRTAREWLVRARKEVRAAIQLVEFRIDMNGMDQGSEAGGSQAD